MADERTDLIKRLAPLVLEDRSRAAADKRSTDICYRPRRALAPIHGNGPQRLFQYVNHVLYGLLV